MVDIFALLDLKELNFEGVCLLSSRGEVGVQFAFEIVSDWVCRFSGGRLVCQVTLHFNYYFSNELNENQHAFRYIEDFDYETLYAVDGVEDAFTETLIKLCKGNSEHYIKKLPG